MSAPLPLALEARSSLWTGVALALGLVAVLGAVWFVPVALLLFPALVFGGGVLIALLRRERLALGVLLGGQLALLTHSEGLVLSEVAYGVFFLTYLGWWYFRRLTLGTPLLRSTNDLLLLLVLGVVTPLSALVGFVFGADPGAVASEVWAFAVGAVYFPVKEACREDGGFALWALGILAGLGLCLAVFNVLSLRFLIAAASESWQVADARFALNEHYLVIGALVPLLYLVVVPRGMRWAGLAGLAVLFAFMAGALIMAKSRAYWGALLIASALAFVAFRSAERRRLVTFGVLGVAGIFLVGSAALGADTLLLILDGVVRRALTLQSALSQDISLLNRYEETAATMAEYWKSPVLGQGLGAEVRYYNWIILKETSRAYIHNGFAWMLLKLGVVGSAVLLLVYFRTTIAGWKLYRRATALPERTKVASLTAATMLAGMFATTYTSNPFVLADISFLLFCLMGVCNGLVQREREQAGA
jgi:hypothetical protein